MAELVPTSWQVMEPHPVEPARLAAVPLSRRYSTQDAAEAYLELARKNGHPMAYVRVYRTNKESIL